MMLLLSGLCLKRWVSAENASVVCNLPLGHEGVCNPIPVECVYVSFPKVME